MKGLLRRGLGVLIGVGVAAAVAAQGFDVQELVLDVQKLTELRQVLTDLKQGYQVLETGYTTIRDISQGSFNLHKAFLDALLAVSPEVKQYQRVADIISLEASMVKRYRAAIKQIGQGYLSVAELGMIGKVYGGLMTESANVLSDLADVLTDGVYRASDAERIGAIDRLYSGMTERSDFMDRFTASAVLLSQQRLAEADEITVLRRLYALEP